MLVVGGGTAGFVVAIAAARNGAETILAEYLPFLGGTHGGGAMVMGTIGFRPTGESSHRVEAAGELMVGGIPLEYYDRMLAGRATSGIPGDPSNAWPKDLEISKVVIEEMVSEAGADIWFMSQLVDVIVDDGAVVGALVTRGGGLVRIDTRVIVDASGDGIAAVQAGARYEVGRPSDNKSEAATLYFEMAGIDLDGLLDYLADHPEDISHHHRNRGVSAATLRRDWEADGPFVVRLGVKYASSSKAGLLPTPVGAEHSAHTEPSLGTFWMHWRDGRWVASSFSVNMDTTYGLDPRDRDAYDDALVATRRFVLDMVRYYQANAPGFEKAYLLRFATLLGVREGPPYPRPVPADRGGCESSLGLPGCGGPVRRPDRYPSRGPGRAGVPALGRGRGARLVPGALPGAGGRRCRRSDDGRTQHLGRPRRPRVGPPPGHLYDDRPGSRHGRSHRRPSRGCAT